jgi:hypothetical protein
MPRKKTPEEENEQATETFTVTDATTMSSSASVGNVSVTATVVPAHNYEALKIADELEKYLASRLHGPWEPIMFNAAKAILDRLRSTL